MNHSEPHEEEENYFISLSDLMTGVVFIFVILLCAFAFHYQTEAKTATSAATEAVQLKAQAAEASKLAEQERTIAESQRQKAETSRQAALQAEEDARKKGERIDALSLLLRQRDESLRALLQGLVQRLAQRGVRVIFDSQTGVIRLPEELLFDRGSDILSESGRHGLSVLADELAPVLSVGCAEGSLFRLEAVFIEGHTDADPVRTSRFSDNWDLSAARATNTYRAVIAAKPELEQFVNPTGLRVLGVSGYGENRPVEPNATDEQKKRNRRVDLRFLMAHPTGGDVDRARREVEKADVVPAAEQK